MTDQTEAPERIWAGDAKLGSPDDKYWWPNDDTGGVEYIRADLSDAKDKRIAELEAERDEQVQWVKDLADDVAHLEAKLAKVVELLEWQTRLVDNSVTSNNETTHRISIAGTWYTGPVVDWTHSVLTNWKKINRTALTELKGERKCTS